MEAGETGYGRKCRSWGKESKECGSMMAGEKNPKSVWWNDEIKATVKRKVTAWKKAQAVSSEEA